MSAPGTPVATAPAAAGFPGGREGGACPRLEELPPPPAGKTGWPWTEETAPLPPSAPCGRPWPRITIVTPSFNQADFLEETIRSVLLQGYPNLEYIVMDGGSTDDSVDVIRTYEPWLSYWRSGKDRGQSDAINTGFARATGSVIGWLNSDDIYYPGALGVAGAALADGEADVILAGMDKVLIHGGQVDFVKRSTPFAGRAFHRFPVFADGRRHDFHFTQPPCLWTRELWERTNGLDDRYHYQMDREWLSRALAAGARVRTSDAVLARFTLHPGSKSHDFVHRFELERVKLYLRLSRMPGFRFWPCLASTLGPLAYVLSHRAGEARGTGRKGAAAAYGVASSAVSALRHRIPWLRGDDSVAPGPNWSVPGRIDEG